jgi:hypothetical protein
VIPAVNEMRCVRCRTQFIGADVLCPACRRKRDAWHRAEAEIARLEAARAPGRPLRIVDLRRSRERAS